MERLDYRNRYRRLLVDMHIPDWDPGLLSQYDPRVAADLWQKTGVNAVMFYCQSHVGLCYWPTRSGRMHANLKGRDVVADMLRLLHERDIAGCGYYSVVYNTWAFLEHPEWRLLPAYYSLEPTPEAAFRKHTGRYGLCCPNHPGYRNFCVTQIKELSGVYPFDAFFFDMTFWPGICVCDQCRRRFREEAGADIPDKVDWRDPAWCAFQAARERWLAEFAALLTSAMKSGQPELPVYHNFAGCIHGWTLAIPFSAAAQSDFLGADFYGDSAEEQLACKLFQNLTPHRPLEFMTSRCSNLYDHERTKSIDELRASAYAALQESGAILFIDAINPEGTLQPAVYEYLRPLYDELTPYEPWLGGEPVEQIAIYYSSESRMDFSDNGSPLSKEFQVMNPNHAHSKSVQGMCRVLGQAHLPFGIITRKQLADLRRYPVVILPDVVRMDRAEAEAFRAYVRDGGKLFATRYTSLTETDGTRGEDFLLADVFGCHFAADDIWPRVYLKLTDPVLHQCIAPQRYLSHCAPPGAGILRLRPETEGETLGCLVRTCANEGGNAWDRKWVSIHSTPPWEETKVPALVRNRYGRGECIYSAADLERVQAQANDRLLVHLVKGLLGDRPAWTLDAHPCVRMAVFNQPDKNRLRVALLNRQEQVPAVPVTNLTFTLRPPEGKKFTALVRVPDKTPVPFTTTPEGCLQASVPKLELFAMFAAEYQ